MSVTLLDLQSEVIPFRFKEGLRDSVTKWLNLKYAQAWGSDLWPWRIIRTTTTDITSDGEQQGEWPADLQRVLLLQNPNGDTVEYLNARDFFVTYPPSFENTGEFICHYTATGSVADGALSSVPFFGPVPNGDVSLSLLYERAFGHFNNGGDFVYGGMSAATDYLIWPDEHAHLIVMGASSVGLRMENDDSWQALEQEFQNGLQQMRSQYLPADQGTTGQFGRGG